MARGQTSAIGDQTVSKNGYHYTRTETGWRLTHHLIAEKNLGRGLRENERVSFRNGNRRDLHPDNILVTEKGKASVRARMARLTAKIEELQAELDHCKKLLES